MAKAALLIKKKKWMPILAPKLFNEHVLGETHISEPAQTIGKTVTVSLMTITGDPQRQTIAIGFTMTGVTPTAITTSVTSYSIIPAAVRKAMRKGKEKVEDSFLFTTQDGIVVRAKPLLVTKGKTTGSVLANLRKTLKTALGKIISTTPFETLIQDLVSHKLQKNLSDMLRKIYPLSVCEIRQFFKTGQTVAVQPTPAPVVSPPQDVPAVEPVTLPSATA